MEETGRKPRCILALGSCVFGIARKTEGLPGKGNISWDNREKLSSALLFLCGSNTFFSERAAHQSRDTVVSLVEPGSEFNFSNYKRTNCIHFPPFFYTYTFSSNLKLLEKGPGVCKAGLLITLFVNRNKTWRVKTSAASPSGAAEILWL